MTPEGEPFRFRLGERVFARVTKYMPDNETVISEITHESPAWVVGHFHSAMDYDIINEQLLILPDIPDDKYADSDWVGEERQISLAGGDEWQLFDVDDVPDEVLAAFTRMALLGELDHEAL